MKIALLMPSGQYASTPCVRSLAEELADAGIVVDVFTVKNRTLPSVDKIGNKIQNATSAPNIINYPIVQSGFWENIPVLMTGFFLWLFLKVRRGQYDLIIACGIRALILAGMINLFYKRPYIYNSLELYIQHEITSIKGNIGKKLEKYFNKRAEFTIIQDHIRSKILVEENGINSDSILLFPNSPRGGAVQKDPVEKEYLLNKYSLDPDTKLILYAGTIFAPWAMTPNLIRAAQDWPEHWKLLLHCRADTSTMRELEQFKAIDKASRVLFSTKPLDGAEYEKLVQGCDVGVSLYDGDLSDNIKYVGLSSGKLAQFLKYGLPIIVNNIPMWPELIAKYKCGAIVHQSQEIKGALDKIFKDYERCVENAEQFFDSVLKLDNYTQQLIKAISVLSR